MLGSHSFGDQRGGCQERLCTPALDPLRLLFLFADSLNQSGGAKMYSLFQVVSCSTVTTETINKQGDSEAQRLTHHPRPSGESERTVHEDRSQKHCPDAVSVLVQPRLPKGGPGPGSGRTNTGRVLLVQTSLRR